MEFPREEVEGAIVRLREAFVEAEKRNHWAWIADEFYHEDATYYCPYGGSMPVFARNRDDQRSESFLSSLVYIRARFKQKIGDCRIAVG